MPRSGDACSEVTDPMEMHRSFGS